MRKFKIIIKNIYAFPFCGTDGDPLIRHATRATFPAGEGFLVTANIDYSDTVMQKFSVSIPWYYSNNSINVTFTIVTFYYCDFSDN